MPIVTVPSPLSAIHSCDEVYFRFSGSSTAVSWRAWPTRLGLHAPSVRLPEKLAAKIAACSFGEANVAFSPERPSLRAVLLPESFAGRYPFGASGSLVSPTRGVMGPANLLQAHVHL